jgi:hypothetical protein
MNTASLTRVVSLAIVCAASLALSQPGHAARLGKHTHMATASGEHTGAIVAGQGPNGGRGVHAGGWTGDGSGGAIHTSGGAYSGPVGSAVRGSVTHWGSNGSVAHVGGHGMQGANGGYDNGHNYEQRNPDGSGQVGWANHGQSASGSKLDSTGNFTRGSDGTVSGSSSTSASGARGSYNGSTTAANGTTTHDGHYTSSSGDSYQGETAYTKGQGYTHSGTCKDAQGNVIACH